MPDLKALWTQPWARWPTAIKMPSILGLCLFPLGLVAVLASAHAVREGRQDRETFARLTAVRSVQAIGLRIDRDVLAMRIASAAAALGDPAARPCEMVRMARNARADVVLRDYALFADSGRVLCGNGRMAPRPPGRMADGETRVWLDGGSLRYAVRTRDVTGVGMFDAAILHSVGTSANRARNIDIAIVAGDRRLQLVDNYDRGLLQHTVTHRARLADGSASAVVSTGAIPISAPELLTILLPVLMWLFAALVGWLVADRLLLRPIIKMQKAVLAYRPGSGAMTVPRSRTPATEISDLGDAFARVTRTIAAHEAELSSAIGRQARLVREVHHRVKNNLQVVASLLNLHARGARSEDAADAYASIQRRVDALSVVHRNHFAELEDNRGVALRTLLTELTANLRATAPQAAAGMSIALDLDPVHANQDVAVSIAFFVTEVVEHAMLCTPDRPVSVSLRQTDSPLTARLEIRSASLVEGVDCGGTDVRQFERITTGLSRQLRATLDKDLVSGSYGMNIAVQPDRT